MSTTWLKQDHIEALSALIPYIEDRTVRRRVKEVTLGLTEQLTTQLSRDVVQHTVNEPLNPLTKSELTDIQTLLAKGVQHNGLVPELDTLRVGRTLQIVGELLARAHLSALDFDDQEGLGWIFDVAAEHEDGSNRENVRRVERVVRASMGLETRLVSMIPVNTQPT